MQSVKYVPRALKSGHVIESIIRGHHVTYLIRHRRTVGYVYGYLKKLIRPSFMEKRLAKIYINKHHIQAKTKYMKLIKTVRIGNKVTYTVKVNHHLGHVYAKLPNIKHYVYDNITHHTKVNKDYYYNIKLNRKNYVRLNKPIWIHINRNFTTHNGKTKLHRSKTIHVKHLISANGNVTRFAVNGGYITGNKSLVELI